MRRFLARPVIEALRSPALVALRVVEGALTPPFDAFELRHVHNGEPVSIGGVLFHPVGFAVGPTTASTSSTVDTMTLQLDNAGQYWSRYIRGHAVANRRFRVKLYFPGASQTLDECPTLFDGYAGDPLFAPGTVAFELRAVSASFSLQLPIRTYSSNCGWSLYSSIGCKVSKESNEKSFVADSNGDEWTISNPGALNQQPDYWTPGYVRIEQGEHTGETRPIASFAGGKIKLMLPFEHDPSGTRVKAVRLCGKTKQSCRRFNNLPRYGGCSETPYIPSVDAASVTISSGGAGKK